MEGGALVDDGPPICRGRGMRRRDPGLGVCGQQPGRHSGEAEVSVWMHESAVVKMELSRR